MSLAQLVAGLIETDSYFKLQLSCSAAESVDKGENE